MRYPSIDKTLCAELVAQLVRGEGPSIDAQVTWVGSGDDVDLRALDSALEPFKAQLDQIVAGTVKVDKEVFEGQVAAGCHSLLAALPADVLDDRGFWRYLGLSKFWWYIAWREAKPISAGNAHTYTDASLSVMAIPSRLFLRGQAVVQDGDYGPAFALERSTDFWRSHVLRVRVGSAPRLTRALVRLQREKQMKTDPVLRPYARRLNRTWTNVVLHLYDEDEAYQLLDELYGATVLPPPLPTDRPAEEPV
jgi:hypothetical protein